MKKDWCKHSIMVEEEPMGHLGELVEKAIKLAKTWHYREQVESKLEWNHTSQDVSKFEPLIRVSMKNFDDEYSIVQLEKGSDSKIQSIQESFRHIKRADTVKFLSGITECMEEVEMKCTEKEKTLATMSCLLQTKSCKSGRYRYSFLIFPRSL